MLLALWSGFWNPADWVAGPPPPTPTVTEQSAGHGGKKQRFPWDFERASPDYWDVREKALKQRLPKPVSAPSADKPIAEAEETPLHVSLKLSIPEFVDYSPEIARQKAVVEDISNKLSLQRQALQAKSDEEALLALLL